MFIKSGITKSSSIFLKRCLHQVPRLPNQEKFIERGIEGLYTSEGFKSAWLDYQKYLTLNLTLQTNGTVNESKNTYQILLNTAKQTSEQHTFFFASQAHNNHMFFQQLTDKSIAEKTRPSRLIFERLADQDFPTLASFRDKFLEIAESSLGQGWLFLVELPDKSFKILRCNNDGTPYHYAKNQSLDLNGSADQTAFRLLTEIKEKSSKKDLDFTLPLLVLSEWDPSYIRDYGVTGKRAYLERCWDCINWEVVNKRLFHV